MTRSVFFSSNATTLSTVPGVCLTFFNKGIRKTMTINTVSFKRPSLFFNSSFPAKLALIIYFSLVLFSHLSPSFRGICCALFFMIVLPFLSSISGALNARANIFNKLGVFRCKNVAIFASFSKLISYFGPIKIFSNCYWLQVINVYTRSIHTKVINHQTFWKRSFNIFIDKPMGSYLFSSDSDNSISSFIFRTNPKQTVFFINHHKKNLFNTGGHLCVH